MMLLMIGSVVGVGFVSGTEIEDFFARFGINLFFGIFVLFINLLLLTYKILGLNNYDANNVKMQNINKNLCKNTFLTKYQIRNFCLFFVLLMISSTMFAGLRLILFNLLNNNYHLIYLAVILFVFGVICLGVKGLAKFNCLVLAFVVFMLSVILKNLTNATAFEFGEWNVCDCSKSIVFSLIYVFMNIVEVQPIANEFELNISKRKKFAFAFVFSFIITTIVLLFSLFLRNNRGLAESAMPMLAYFENSSVISKVIFYIGMIFALTSTLITCLIGVKRHVINLIIDTTNLSASFLSILICVIVGLLPYSFFTKTIYPILGVINFIVFSFL